MGFARPLTLAGVTAIACSTVTVQAQQAPMTLSAALARARQVAPQIVSARMATDEARARLAGASQRLQTNPEVDFGLGRRSGLNGGTVDLDLTATQMFEPAGRRTARMDAATAGVERSAAQVDIATRDVLREVAIAFYRTVHADRRIELLAAAESLATTIYQSADRRYRAGDIAVLDVNLARASLARVRSEREAAAADRIRAVSGLRQLLQVDAGVRVEADLAALPAIDRATIPDAATERPEIRELEALVREAEADARFAETFRRPEFGLGASFKKEEGDRAIGGVVKLTLPMFATGRYQREESLARVSRLRAELEARRMLIRVEVDASIEAYTRRRDAVQLLTKEALPGLDENEQLTARSFDAGQIGLPDLLLIRRELLDIRFTYLDALVEAAIARVELDAILGVLR